MPENAVPTPDEAGDATPEEAGDAAPGAAEEAARGRNRSAVQIALITAAGGAVAALITLIGTVMAGGPDPSPTTPAAPIVTTADPPPPVTTTAAPTPTATAAPAGDTPCKQPPTKAHGFSAAFVAPCSGAKPFSPYPVVTLEVPSYPEAEGDGQIWVVVRILTNGQGMPLADRPMYAEYRVDPSTAKDLGATTWTKDLMIFNSCHDYGPAEILTYWLSPSGVKAAENWEPSVPITIPHGSVQLDEVRVTLQAGAC